MAGPYTVDASVFLNAFTPSEPGYQESHRFLASLQQEGVPIIIPTLLLPEVAGAVARGRQDAGLARAFAAGLSRLPYVVLVALDEVLARRAAAVAAQHRLRGSDAVYAAVGLQFGSTLVTLDREQRERLRKVLPVRQPAEIG